jgi:hypothetical protein
MKIQHSIVLFFLIYAMACCNGNGSGSGSGSGSDKRTYVDPAKVDAVFFQPPQITIADGTKVEDWMRVLCFWDPTRNSTIFQQEERMSCISNYHEHHVINASITCTYVPIVDDRVCGNDTIVQDSCTVLVHLQYLPPIIEEAFLQKRCVDDNATLHSDDSIDNPALHLDTEASSPSDLLLQHSFLNMAIFNKKMDLYRVHYTRHQLIKYTTWVERIISVVDDWFLSWNDHMTELSKTMSSLDHTVYERNIAVFQFVCITFFIWCFIIEIVLLCIYGARWLDKKFPAFYFIAHMTCFLGTIIVGMGYTAIKIYA